MRKRLTLKILTLTLVTILLGSGLVVGYLLAAQNRDLLQERMAGVEQQTEVLFESIKNNMLVGTAPIARGLLSDLKDVAAIREIALFRADGQEAFSDDATIRLVNQALGKERFELTNPDPEADQGDDDGQDAGYGYGDDYDQGYGYGDRGEGSGNGDGSQGNGEGGTEDSPTPTATPPPLTDDSTLFRHAVSTQEQQVQTRADAQGRELVYYVPLLNAEECAGCHAPELMPNPEVRGVIRVSTSLGDVDRKIQRNTLISATIWVTIVAVLTAILTQGMQRLVLNPLRAIGQVAGEVERGNLDVRVPVRSQDEIGYLAGEINRMIAGLRERLLLSKFVSKATLEEIAAGAPMLGGEKRELTVLFSDIRGFTAYAERHDPQVVMAKLNTYMQRQAGIILNAGGDVDQFVGDEILGVFRGQRMVRDAVRAALEIQRAVAELNAASDTDIHVGIGIHTGPMVEGNLGAQGDVERLQHTVIGDAVNLGSRICEIAAPGETLLSEAAYTRVGEAVAVGEPRTVSVKGKQQPITVYPVRVP